MVPQWRNFLTARFWHCTCTSLMLITFLEAAIETLKAHHIIYIVKQQVLVSGYPDPLHPVKSKEENCFVQSTTEPNI